MLHKAIFLATCNATMTNKKPFKLQTGCYTQATCLATSQKVEGRSNFLATRNATTAVAKWDVTREYFPQLQLATQRLLRCKLQEKFLHATWPLGLNNRVVYNASCWDVDDCYIGNTIIYVDYMTGKRNISKGWRVTAILPPLLITYDPNRPQDKMGSWLWHFSHWAVWYTL